MAAFTAHNRTKRETSTTAVTIDRRTALLPVAVLAFLNLADVVLTRVGLAYGAVEANPFARTLLRGGRVEFIKVALLCVLTLRVQRRRPTFAMAVACWAAAGAYGMVVVSNTTVVLQLHH